MTIGLQTILLQLSVLPLASGFFPSFNLNQLINLNTKTPAILSPKVIQDAGFSPPDTSDIREEACRDAASKMRRVEVPVPASISPDERVGISYVHWPASNKGKADLPPVVLVHGFDSSCLEYRRLGPELALRGIDAYAVDLLGWGFTRLDNVDDFGAHAKVMALDSFLTAVLGESTDYWLAGASLGGAAAIQLATGQRQRQSRCRGLILIDAQGFVDGVGPMAALPPLLAQMGVAVLKSRPLRSAANQMSYHDKGTYATDDAVAIGRLHCVQQGRQWDRAMRSFMTSGGFRPSAQVPTITVPTLILWGRQDGILDGDELAIKFVDALPNLAELRWIEECGHVPHLEQPQVTANLMEEFLRAKTMDSSPQAPESSNMALDALAKLFQFNGQM